MKLIPIVVMVTDETLRALDDYVTHVESIVHDDAPDVEVVLGKVVVNGWTPTMLIAGSLLAQALEDR